MIITDDTPVDLACAVRAQRLGTVGTVSNDGDDRVSLTDLAERAGLPPELVTRLIQKGRITVIGVRGRFRVVSAADAELVTRLAPVARRSGLPLATLLDAVRSGAARWSSGNLVLAGGESNDQEGDPLAA